MSGTNAEYRRRYKEKHPGRVKKQNRQNYKRHRAKKLAQANARHARARAAKLAALTPTQEEDVKISPEALKRARELYALEFKRAVHARIEREREERVSKPVHVLNAERDALITTLNAAGQSVAHIADAVRVTVKHVREVLSLSTPAPKVKPSRPAQLEFFPMEGLRHG